MPTTHIRRDREARRELRRALDDLADAQRDAGVRDPAPRWWWIGTGLVVITALIAATLGVVAWIRAADAYTDDDFEATASRVVGLLLSPDATAPQRVREILDDAGGGFYDEFAQSADAYTAFVRRSGTVAAATIDGTGVATRTASSATVLVAATVGYRRDGQADADRRFRLRIGVAEDAGRLKVAAVQYLP
ncbi:hypothetical protein ABLE92_15065 [Gordonia sp. VNQ95]|uniref:hypothetical protein n=1 Tax=Gordonia sp. VNQ95 TaxID=3156619 RepID=UPI0032B61E04